MDFLERLEPEDTTRTRNNRLTAISAFFRRDPTERSQKKTIEFRRREWIEALVAAPDLATWLGRRDRTLLLVFVQTGPRVSELTWLRRDDIVLGRQSACTMRG